MSGWLYKGKPFTEEQIGSNTAFVYEITNLRNNKKYIGKKVFNFVRRTTQKGKKVKVLKPSDWKKYFGSNKVLIEEVKTHGEDDFKREILHLCKNKGQANYLELKEQILKGALESDAYYNEWIRVRIHKSHTKGTKGS